MKISVKAGATSQSVNVFVRDSSSTTGAGLAAVAPAGGSLLTGTKLYYSFTGANASAGVAVSLSVLAAVNSAWSSAGIVTLDATNMIGWVRIDLPDAALASSKGRVVSFLLFGGTNMAPTPFEIELTGWDNQDGVHGGMTALPNAAAAASGGLLISGSNSGTTTLGALTVTGDLTVSGNTIHTGTTTHTGNVAMAAGLTITQSTTNTAGLAITGNGSGAGVVITGGAAVTTTSAGVGLSLVGGAASTSAGGVAAVALLVTGGAGAASTNGAAGGGKFIGGSTNTVASAAHGLAATGTSTGSGVIATSGGGSGGDGITATSVATDGYGLNCTGHGALGGIGGTGGATGPGINGQGGTSGPGMLLTSGATTGIGLQIVAQTLGHGISVTGAGNGRHGILATGGTIGTCDGIKAVAGTGGVGMRLDSLTVTGAAILSSTLTVSGATTLTGLTTGAFSCTTFTASGAVAFQSTFAVTTSTALAALSCTTLTASGAVAFQSTFAVTTSTSLAALSCTTLTASGAVAFQSTFIVTSGVTFTAGLTSNITGTLSTVTTLTNLPAITTDWISAAGVSAAAVTKIQAGLSTYAGGAVASVTGDVAGKVLGGGAGVLSGVGVQSDLQTIKTQTVTCAAGVTVGAFVGNATHALVVDASGFVTVVTNNDKAGYSISGSKTTLDSLNDLSQANVRSAVGLASANLDTQLAAIAGYIDTEVAAILIDTDAIKAKTDHLPSSDIVHTTGKLWVLDSNGNAVAPASDSSAIKAKTDNLPASPAAVGSAMNLAAGAISDTTFTVPAEASGRPTSFLSMMRRVFEWAANKRTRNRTTGDVVLRNAGDTGTLETQTQSTSGVTDTQTKGV